MASARVAYFLWLFFGLWGIHLLYLGRRNQAIIWFTTLGGFGIGWLRDFWKIPDYLKWYEADKDKDYQKDYLTRVLRDREPHCSYFRIAGMFVMAFWAAAVFSSTVPDFMGLSKVEPWKYNMCRIMFVAFIVCGNALGVYLVANNGEIGCTPYYPILGSLSSVPWLYGRSQNFLLSAALTTWMTWYRGLRFQPLLTGTEEARTEKKHYKNVSIYLVACLAWMVIISYGFYFNAMVTTNDGEKIPVREAISNFFKSPAWRRTKDSFTKLFNIYRHAGWGRAFSDARSLFDFSGEVNAFKVLDLPPGTSQEEITRHCRKMKGEFHPDRFRTEEEKETAQEKFIEIQEACNTLSKAHARKSQARRASDDD